MRVRRLALLGLVVGVCLLLLTVQTRGHRARAADALALLTTPAQRAVAAVHRVASGAWTTYRDWKDVRGENRRLREEIERLRIEGLRVSETSEENRRLRRLLVLREMLPLTTVAGEVIGRESGGWGRALTVNRGRGDDVTRMSAVIAPEGLVGRVVDLRPGAAVVQVVTDPASTVGGHAVRSRTAGIVEGGTRGTLRFKYMAREGEPPVVGDLIVTSGAGGMFPRGIPIGRVRAIDDRGSAMFHFAVLVPAVDLARLEEVLLLTGARTHDLTAYFPAEG